MSNLSSETATRSNRWSLALRIALSGGLLGYLLSRVDWPPLAAAMRDMNWWGWTLAAVLNLVSQIASGMRWAGLARPLGFAGTYRRYLRLYFEGMFFSLCLPSAIGGDVFKAIRLGTTARGRVLAGCTVLADRLSGLAAVLVIGCSALIARNAGLSPVNGWLTGIGLFVLALALTSAGLALLGPIVRSFPSHSGARHFAERLLPYHHKPAVFWRAIGWSMIVQGLNVVCVALIGWALGLEAPFEAYLVSVPIVALMTAVPISLAGVGVREGGMVWILSSWYGVSNGLAVAIGLLWFSVAVVAGLIGGLVYLLSPPLVYDSPPAAGAAGKPADRSLESGPSQFASVETG